MDTLDDIPKDIAILVIDDIPTARKVVTRLLSGLGFTNVTEMAQGKDALSLIESQEFHLVITDLHLKDMLGVDLLEEARKQQANADLPFVVITSDMSRESFDRVARKRYITYLLKPFNKGQLGQKMMEVLCPADDM
jgi:two-component system chemotaxis response regulator CheY